MHRSMGRNNVKIMPFSRDVKAQVLGKLQGIPHFEKILTVGSVRGKQRTSGELTVPSWFVQRHGERIRKSVILRTESSTKAWPVNLAITWPSRSNFTQVRFRGGWTAFTNSNGLVEGDSLVFALTAMSKFEVYIFRNKSMQGLPSQAQIRNHSEFSRKQTSQCLKVPQTVADEEGSFEGIEKVAGLNHVTSLKYKTVADEGTASSSGPDSPTSIRCFESQENSTFWQQVTRDSLLPRFKKKLTATNICLQRGCGANIARLEIPREFLKKYSSRIHSVVKLQGIHDESPVRTMRSYTLASTTTRHSEKLQRQCLRKEWREFVNENYLHVGQELFFIMAADSFYVVREAQQPLS